MSKGIYTYLETESFETLTNAQVRSGSYASGGQYVQHSGGGQFEISTTITGRPGTYDVAISYFDENDGASTSRLLVDGVEKGAWTWDKQLGSSNAGSSTRTTHIIKNVEIDADANLTITGQGDRGEEFRIDTIELLPASRGVAGANLEAFDGAEGFGANTIGGRGGAIVKVTNLNDSGVGSLRWALEDLEMPRIVVFDVGGKIDLTSEIQVRGDVTVAGQTAPGDGITITGARLRVVESDVIIRGLKFRPGDNNNDSLEDRDAISVGTDLRSVQNVIIDSNSMSWAIDETAVVWSGAHHITFSKNIIAEGLNRGQPSYGMLLGDGAHHISVVGNLFANNAHRNPQLLGVTEVEIYNNVISNWGDNGIEIPVGANQHSTANIVGNIFLAGPDSSDVNPIRLRGTSSESAFYVADNAAPGIAPAGGPLSSIIDGTGLSLVERAPVFLGSGIQALMSDAVYNAVLGSVGARTQGVDTVDARIINSVRNRDGDIISHPSDVGGLGLIKSVRASRDADNDGIPDAYEAIVGSNASEFDPHGDANNNGWTNIEDYINGLIDDFDFGISDPRPPITPEPVQTIHVEAEAMDLVEGFTVNSNADASSGQLLKAQWGAARSEAQIEYKGAPGTYGITLNYFDESDGESTLSVLVAGRPIGTWRLEADLGNNWANEDTLTSRTITGVELEVGDVISIVGMQDGGEPVRIDGFTLFV